MSSKTADITLPGAEFRSIPSYMPSWGEMEEGILEAFPALSLEQVFGAVAFYLANRESIDTHLLDAKAEFAPPP